MGEGSLSQIRLWQGKNCVARNRCYGGLQFNKTGFSAVVGGGQVVSVLAFNSDDPSSIPAKVYSFYSVNYLKRRKINKKRPRMTQFLKSKTGFDTKESVLLILCSEAVESKLQLYFSQF